MDRVPRSETSAHPMFHSLVLLALAASIAVLAVAVTLAEPVDARRARHAEVTVITAAGGPAAFLWEWSPSELTIAKGDRVAWENPTSAAHAVEVWDGPTFFTGDLATGKRFTLKFKKPGDYKYRCPIAPHSDIVYAGTERICVGMCGVITVE